MVSSLFQLLKNQEKLGLSDNIILKETAFYLLAGAFTSIHTLTHAMHELFERIKDPIQENRVMNDPIYLQRCIHESMRLHPSSPTAMRRPTCPFHTNDGTILNKSDTLVIDFQLGNVKKFVINELTADQLHITSIADTNYIPLFNVNGIYQDTVLINIISDTYLFDIMQ